MPRTKKREVALRPGTTAWVLVQAEPAGDGQVVIAVSGDGCDPSGYVDLLAQAIPVAHAAAVARAHEGSAAEPPVVAGAGDEAHVDEDERVV